MDNKLSQIYLKPKTNAHVRVGEAFQADIPQSEFGVKHKDKVIVETDIKFDLNANKVIIAKKEEEIIEDIKPSKKRKLDN